VLAGNQVALRRFVGAVSAFGFGLLPSMGGSKFFNALAGMIQ